MAKRNLEIETKQLNLWRRYLLGTASERERASIEDAFLADQAMVSEIEMMESEMIEDYLADQLSSAESRPFESAYLQNPIGQKKVARMRLIIDEASARGQTSKVEKPFALSERFAAFFKSHGWQIAIAVPAVVLVALFGIWFLIPADDGSIVAEGVPVASPSSIAVEEPALPPIITTPDDANDNRTRSTPSPTPRKPPAAERQPTLAVFLLKPGGVRGASSDNRIRVAPQTSVIGLQLELESDIYRSYSARVTTVDGKSVFASSRLRPNKNTVLLQLPVNKLIRGDYVVELAGITRKGQAESVNDYSFSIEK